MTANEPRRRSRTVVALVVVVLLVLGTVGVVAAVASRERGPATPPTVTSPTLSLSRTSNVSGAGAAVAPATDGKSGAYVLATTLSTATQDGVVIDPSGSSATEAQVRSLVTALGMSDPKLTSVPGAGWTATGTASGQKAAFALDEKAGNVWQYARGAQASCLAVRPGAAPDTAVSCAATVAPGTSTGGAASKAGPGRKTLLKDARTVFDLVGVTPGTGLLTHDDGNGATYLDVPLTVESLPVVDVTLSVAADADGLVSAFGWLDPTFATVGTYPLVSQRTAFAELAATPVPEPAIACAPGSPCPTQAPRKVTAARLAWLTTQDHGRTVLVPAWQFEVDGFYGPAVVAVAPQYLAGPSTAPTAGTGGGSGGAPGASAAPGAPGSAEPGTAEPAPPTTVAPPRDKKVN